MLVSKVKGGLDGVPVRKSILWPRAVWPLLRAGSLTGARVSLNGRQRVHGELLDGQKAARFDAVLPVERVCPSPAAAVVPNEGNALGNGEQRRLK